MRLFLTTVSFVLLAGAAAATAAPFVWGQLQIGACQERCCCKVCSSPTAQAYPYGLINKTLSVDNPVNPGVVGAACLVPTWADRGPVNNTVNALVQGPDTLFWTALSVFSDTAAHVAPTNCDCCKLSVDTNCAEEAPIARRPALFKIELDGAALEGKPGAIVFEGGYALSGGDLAELRNDTHCGYRPPAYLMRTSVGQLVPNTATTHNTWYIPKLPNHGCYRVCYYHSNLTTPGWYYIGDIVVHRTPQSTLTHILDPADVLLAGNEVTLDFIGQGLLNIFSDRAELRTSGSCGGVGFITNTASGSNGGLDVLPGADWCHPPVVPGITATRPLRKIAVTYQDCPLVNRLYVDRLRWKLTLPLAATTTYTVCYRRNGTWATLPNTLTVPGQLTAAAALQSLYASTGGNQWLHAAGWGGTNACVFHGVRCDASGNVVSVYLGRNKLSGTLPVNFFRGAYFNTITDLKLDMNALTGTVPKEIGTFRKLRVLDLSYNQLSGTLPISLLRSDLQTVYVAGNDLDGTVPYQLTQLSQQWTAENELVNEPTPVAKAACPTPVELCSDRGSTTPGVSECGYSSITEAECLIRGCCFNAQAPLTFGGTACFTKREVTYETLPPCNDGRVTCTPQSSSS
jgi:hypothetical protein